MKIKEKEYIALVGLLALAATHRKPLKDIEAAVASIVKEPAEDNDHSWEAVWVGMSAKELIQRVDASEVYRKKKARKAQRKA